MARTRPQRLPVVLGVAAAAGLVTLGAVLPGLTGGPGPSTTVAAAAGQAEIVDVLPDAPTPATTDVLPADNPLGGGGLVTGNGLINTDLSLTSVYVVSQDLDDTDAEYLQFTFSRPLVSVADESGFALGGLSRAAQATSISAELVNGDPSSVLVGYEAGTDVEAFTLATIDQGVALDEEGRTNAPGTAELAGATTRSADVPKLVSVESNTTLNQVIYRFDRNLDENEGSVDASRLGLYTVDGRAIPAQSVVTVNNESVTVSFEAQVEDGVRHYVDAGAVTDARGVANVPLSVGDTTTAPDLTGVSDLIGRTQFDFTFDQPVADVDPARFTVYTPDGAEIAGSSVVLPSANVVRVAFPEIQEFGDGVTLAAVAQGAASSNDGFGTESTVGTRQLGAAAGTTSGPDLEAVAFDTATGQVRYVFDESIDEDAGFAPGAFAVITTSGDVIAAESFVEVDGNTVLVGFSPAVAQAAAAATVADGAVADEQGETNPLGTREM